MVKSKINFPKERQAGEFPLGNPSQIEHVDFAIFKWLDEILNLSCNTNEGFKKVPIIWAGQERAFSVKKNIEEGNMDPLGVWKLPLITLERTNITKDLKKKGKFWANIPPVMDEKGGSITITREINQEKTAAFASSRMNKKYKQKTFKSFKPEDKNKQIVYFTKTIPLPIYVLITYEIIIKTNFQTQMNEIIHPIITYPRRNKLFCC